jgi:hypothetical protein
MRVRSLANGDFLSVYLCIQVVRWTPILYNQLLHISEWGGGGAIQQETRNPSRSVKVVMDSQEKNTPIRSAGHFQ